MRPAAHHGLLRRLLPRKPLAAGQTARAAPSADPTRGASGVSGGAAGWDGERLDGNGASSTACRNSARWWRAGLPLAAAVKRRLRPLSTPGRVMAHSLGMRVAVEAVAILAPAHALTAMARGCLHGDDFSRQLAALRWTLDAAGLPDRETVTARQPPLPVVR